MFFRVYIVIYGTYQLILLCHEDMAPLGGGQCSTAIGGGPFSLNLPPKLAVSRNMAGISCSTQG